jgi:hypothetical protein
MFRMTTSFLAFFAVLSLTGCEEKKGSSSEAQPVVDAPKPETPKVEERKAPPRLVMYAEASGVSVGGSLLDAKRSDLETAIGDALSVGAFTIPDPLEVSVARQTLMPTVRAVVGAIRKHGEKQFVIKTATRKGDLAAMPLTLSIESSRGATATGIGKDGAISVWPAAGGAVRKKSRGFAGPDLTLGGELVGKAVGEGSAIIYNGDDAVQWGLVFDLARTRADYKNASTAPVTVSTGPYEPGKKAPF